MPQDLRNSIVALVNSLDSKGRKGYATYSMLFSVVVHLQVWNNQNQNYTANMNTIIMYMHTYLQQHFRNTIPMPNPNTITNRFMKEIDKTINDLNANANNLNVLLHIQ